MRILLSIGFLILIMAVSGCSSGRPSGEINGSAEQRQIAEACLSLLHSSLKNEMDIESNDRRLPEVIRALNPLQIMISENDVVILRAGPPAEYHFKHLPHDPKPWVLYVAGSGYNGHQEVLRLNHD